MNKYFQYILIVTLIALFWGPSLLLLVENSLDPLIFNDDVRQAVVPFFSDWNNELFVKDYAIAYERALIPIGTKLLYMAAANYVSPDTFSSILQLVLYLLLLITLAIVSYSLGDTRTMTATLVLTLSSSIFLQRMVGGLSRSFAFPLMSLLALALVKKSLLLNAFLVLLFALFYPPMAQVSFYTLLALLLWKFKKTGKREKLRKVIVLGLTAILALLIVMPLLNVQEKYGPTIGIGELEDYPEAGPGGRYGFDDRPPFPSVFYALADIVGRTFQSGGGAFCPPAREWLYGKRTRGKPTYQLVVILTVMVLIMVSFSIGTIMKGEMEALLSLHLLLFAAILAYLLSCFFYPALFVPWRAIVYPLPIFLVLLFPLSLLCLVQRLTDNPKRESILFYLLLFCCFLFLGGRGAGDEGFKVNAHQEKALYEYIKSLPSTSIIAGFPKGVLDNVPYLCQKSALVTNETHQAFHKDYVREMRLRMELLLSAYFSTEKEKLVQLHKKYGVTHILIDLRHYTSGAPPKYFAPFNKKIRELTSDKKRDDYILLKVPARDFGHFRLINLSKVVSSS